MSLSPLNNLTYEDIECAVRESAIIRAAVLVERERCAKIAEDATERPDEWDVPALIAQRIRKRG